MRPSGIQTQRPYTSKPSTTNAVTTVVKIPSLSDNSISDLDTAASISTGCTYQKTLFFTCAVKNQLTKKL